MSSDRVYDYFYGMESDQYSFIRVPKILFRDPEFREMSSDAKILYGMMLDRMALSQKNNWFDSEMRAYICFSVDEAVEELCCGRNKAMKSIQELEKIGLIERKRIGQGKNSIIYVKKFMESSAGQNTVQKFKNQTSGEKEVVSEVPNLNFQKFKNQTSRSLKSKLQEVDFWDPNNTDIKDTDLNNTDINILSYRIDREDDTMRCDENQDTHWEAYNRLIRENLSLDVLLEQYPDDREIIEGIADLILETVLSSADEILIASSRYPKELVRSRLLKLDSSHVRYAIDCLKKNTTKVKNIRKYLLAVLFNAPATIDSYYRAEVNHDFPQYADNVG